MPKDHWKNARTRAKYGPVRTRKDTRAKRKLSKNQQIIESKRLSRPETILWFGKHKGTKLKDCPTDYLQFLLNLKVANDNARAYRFRALQRGIKLLLEGEEA